MTTGGDVLVERRGATSLLTLNRSERRNAVGGTLFAELLAGFEAADVDDEIRAVVTIGNGPTYCVGADREELGTLALPLDLDVVGLDGVGGAKGCATEPAGTEPLGIGRWVQRILAVGVPSVAALNGGAGGGGLAVAVLHDVRVAARTARFSSGFGLLGLAPEMGLSWLLPRIIGHSRAFDVLTRVGPIEADEALTLGLVDQVVEPDELLDAALARAEAFAALDPASVRTTKRLLRQAWDSSLETQLEREWTAQGRLFRRWQQR